VKHTNGNTSVVTFVRGMNGIPTMVKYVRDLQKHLQTQIENSYQYETFKDRNLEDPDLFHEIHWNMKIRDDGELDFDVGIRVIDKGVKSSVEPELRLVPHPVLKRYVEILGGLIEWLKHDGKTFPGQSDNDYPWPADRKS
jgi:hypothetical protein